MLTISQREYLTLTLILAVFIAFLIPSLLTARAEVRDGLRREDITYLKRSLEQFFNTHEYYPLVANADCITSTNLDSWDFIETLPHDVREAQGHVYRYCVTDADQAGASGYFVEAKLEVNQANGTFFDEDELRKFHYRIIHQDDETFYRVCGGTELQCEE